MGEDMNEDWSPGKTDVILCLKSLLQTGEDINRLVPWKHWGDSAPGRVYCKQERISTKTGPLETPKPFCTRESQEQMGEHPAKDWSPGKTKAILYLGESTANRRGYQQRLVLSKHWGHSAPGRVYKRERISTKTSHLERLRPLCAFRVLILKPSPKANFPYQWSHWILKRSSMSKVTTSPLFLLKGCTHDYSSAAVNCGNMWWCTYPGAAQLKLEHLLGGRFTDHGWVQLGARLHLSHTTAKPQSYH